MKTWTNPTVEELEVELTARGWDHARHECWWHHGHQNPNPNPNPGEGEGEVEIPEIDEEGTPS